MKVNIRYIGGMTILKPGLVCRCTVEEIPRTIRQKCKAAIAILIVISAYVGSFFFAPLLAGAVTGFLLFLFVLCLLEVI